MKLYSCVWYLLQYCLIWIKVATPLIVIIWLFPEQMSTDLAMVITALCMGLLFAIDCYRSGIAMQGDRSADPTGITIDAIKAIMMQCNMDPKAIRVLYGYGYGSVAVHVYNMIIIDALIWVNFDKDMIFQKIQDELVKKVFPAQPDIQRRRINALRDILSPEVQQFIIKHELGHVYYASIYYELLFVAAKIGTVTYAALRAGLWVYRVQAYPLSVAVLLALAVSYLSTCLINGMANLFSGAYGELKADAFAAQYSTAAEIYAAADFFKQHQQIRDTICEAVWDPLGWIPYAIRYGYPSDSLRARQLRKCAEKK